MLWKRRRSDGPVKARARMGPLDGHEVEVSRDTAVIALPRPEPHGPRATVDYRLSRTNSGAYVLDYLEDQRPADPTE